MRIAFYAPLKSPDHPIPSGDRLLARNFVAALKRAGHDVSIAERLRTFDGTGDERRQHRLARLAQRCAERLVSRWKHDTRAGPDLWFTYHIYHKAPDWIGPAVSRALDIPYVVAEASIARKQRDGPWRFGHAAVVDAVRSADAVISINPGDVPGIAAERGNAPPPIALAPYLDVDAWAASARSGQHSPWSTSPLSDDVRIVTVAMMRPGYKLTSYRVLADALARIAHRPWGLMIAGDGSVRADVERAFASFRPGRVAFTGAKPREAIAGLLASADMFVWPAVDESIGMVFLEAQALGVPVVAGRQPGVAGVVADGVSGILVPATDDVALAGAVDRLIVDADRRREMGLAAGRYVREHHDVSTAAVALDAIVQAAVRRRTRLPRDGGRA
ncbi:MAG TPA: glycosyltransferase family 4 protein [Casimicrobiaceae bacterium]|nr:glycosyltransferase family 4 protein [Casimicrobiaceae bacterium]